MDNIHQLKGSDGGRGGLVIKKKSKEDEPRTPKVSMFGLDQLAETKRKEKTEELENQTKRARQDKEDKGNAKPGDRHYRPYNEETPTYTGGPSKEYQKRLERRRDRDREKGLHISTKDKRRDRDEEHYLDRSERKERDRKGVERRGDRSDRRERGGQSERSERGDGSSRRGERVSGRYWETPKRMDEPGTPRTAVKNTPGRSGWDEEDTPGKYSTWDASTPSRSSRRQDWSLNEKSERSFKKPWNDKSSETPLLTPTYKANKWAKDRRGVGATPAEGEEGEEEWVENQDQLDRDWYHQDEGYDETNNPFAGVTAEYTQKREAQLEQRKKRRMTEKQKQIQKDNELWERNRMLTSGVVTKVDVDEDFEEESEARVHLLVHNIVPPFLDGRIVFTKQPEPVVPVKLNQRIDSLTRTLAKKGRNIADEES